MSASEVYKVNANDRFGPIWKFTKLTPMALLLAGCGDVSGQPAEPPPPPAIVAGYYIAVGSDLAITDIPSWEINLPQGGRTRQAEVLRCYETCTSLALPVRAGLNGLSITVPAEVGEPAYDLAISVTPEGPRLSYDIEGSFVVEPLIKSRRVPRPTRS